MSEPIFSTERLDVFHIHAERNEALGCGRDVYVAFHRLEDVPYPIVVLTLFGNYVEWIETMDIWRRHGYGTELVRGMEKSVGILNMEGVTEAGEAFCDKLTAMQTE